MKKVAIAIISSLYVIAIVLIAFLGISGEVTPSKEIVNVEQLVLEEVKGLENGRYEYFYDGSESEESKVYGVYSRPKENEINQSTGVDQYGDLWNINGVRMQYIVKIYNLNYVMDTPNWKVGQSQGTYQIHSQVIPENSSIQGVIYGSSETSVASVSESGLITFTKQSIATRYTVTAKSLDSTGVLINIRFIVGAYK